MRRLLPRRPGHGTIVAYLALFVALGGTSAYAINTIGSSDVINESLLSEDIKNLQVGTSDLAIGAVFGTRIRDNAILSNHIVDNSLTGDDIKESTLDIPLGVHAYGRVDVIEACTGDPVLCTPEKSKGISEVRRVTTGEYCVTVPGVDARNVAAVAGADFDANFSPEGNTTALVGDPEAGSCPNATAFVVVTERQQEILVNKDGGMSNQSVAGNAAPANDVGFQIVVPR